MDIKIESMSLDIVWRRIKDGSLNPSPDFQRTYVWREPMLSELILSILEKYPIGNIILYQRENKDKDIDSEFLWDTIDGQQRLITIKKFLEGNLKLSPDISRKIIKRFIDYFKSEVEKENVKNKRKFEKTLKKYDMGGTIRLTYDDLPKKLQQRIINYPMQLTYIIDATENDVREYFRRVQNQEKLKAGEIINALPPGPITSLVRDLTDYGMLKDKFGFNDKRYEFPKILMNLIGIYEGNLKLGDSDKKILKFAESTDKISSETEIKLRTIGNFLNRVRETDIKIKLNKTGLKLLLFYTSEYGAYSLGKYNLSLFLTTLESVFVKLRVFRSRDPRAVEKIFEGYSDDIIQKYEKIFSITYQTHSLSDIREAMNALDQVLEYEVRDKERKKGNNFRKTFSDEQKRKLLEKAGYKCEMCGMALTIATAQIDHIIPLSRGGTNDIDNLQILCEKCNKKKYDRLLD